MITCPICGGLLVIDSRLSKCNRQHEFQVIDGIVDLMPSITDKNMLNEEQHWDSVAKKGRMKIMPDVYTQGKVFETIRTIIKQSIIREWPDYKSKNVCIGEIGCASGSAISYLDGLEFSKVNYVGVDISLNELQLGVKRRLPDNWEAQFVRTSVNVPVFNENSINIIFSASVLHHLELESVMKWLSKSLKSKGLFILYEPSDRNPLAKIGRKLIDPNFFTESERPISANQVKQLAYKYNLKLIFEKGLHFLTVPLGYLFGILNLPKQVVYCIYPISRLFDYIITSPSWSYSFIQIYKKI